MTIIVTGAASGLGLEIALAIGALRPVKTIAIGFDIEWGLDVRDPQGTFGECAPDVDALINCAGINRPAWLQDVTDNDWDDAFSVNTKGIFKMSQWALPSLKANRGTIVNIISSAAQVPMRCSAAYNASKAAAHMLTLQMARELSPDITVFGISPNKLAGTAMSRDIDDRIPELRGWSQDTATSHQIASLLPGVETPPARVAEFLAFLLSDRERHRYLTGTVIPYGA